MPYSCSLLLTSFSLTWVSVGLLTALDVIVVD